MKISNKRLKRLLMVSVSDFAINKYISDSEQRSMQMALIELSASLNIAMKQRR